MKDWVHTEDLFCNDYNAVVLCEHTRELDLLKKIIEIAERAVAHKENSSLDSFEGVCHLFAKSITDYAKMAYDNLTLGHFSATRMVIRALIENSVCLEIIYNDEKEELWKYYLVQSFRNLMMQTKTGLTPENEEFIKNMYTDYDICKEFYERRGNKKPYIEMQYGWTYKVNHNGFNFCGLCRLVDARVYDDYKMMSEYSHGTSIYQKVIGGNWIENILNMISCIYVGVYRLVTMYCWQYADDEFDEIAEEIENSICSALGLPLLEVNS